MALVLEPELIIADEPTTALDVTVQAEILDLLRRCRDEFGAAIILITHNMGVVADLADRVAVMYNGELVEQAPVVELFSAPKHAVHEEAARARCRGSTWNRIRPKIEERLHRSSSREDLVIEFAGRFGRGGFRAVDGVSFIDRARARCSGSSGRAGRARPRSGAPSAGLTKVSGGSLKVLGHEMPGSGSATSGRCASRSGSCSRTRPRASTRC